MTDPAAIQGDYADYKLIKTRGVVQVVLEFPIDEWKSVVDLLGMPVPGSNVPVAIARLAEKPTNPYSGVTDQNSAAIEASLTYDDDAIEYSASTPTTAAQAALAVERAGSVPTEPAYPYQNDPGSATAITNEPKPKRPFRELPPSQQAGILCNDAGFQRWFCVSTAERAAQRVRNRCTVHSRAELDTNENAAGTWADVLTAWEAASGRIPEDRG